MTAANILRALIIPPKVGSLITDLLPYFTDGKTEAHRGLATGLRSHSWYVVKPGCKPWLSGSRACASCQSTALGLRRVSEGMNYISLEEEL